MIFILINCYILLLRCGWDIDGWWFHVHCTLLMNQTIVLRRLTLTQVRTNITFYPVLILRHNIFRCNLTR
uniref:Secreted protein n=1 Tax=Rhizophora mucronata TaxID=61149 RepID=A0A2P2PK64_RHIMU